MDPERTRHARRLFAGIAPECDRMGSVLSFGQDPRWRRFPLSDADSMLLALRVGGLELSGGHGFPARIVAPGRRGFWWVKWVERIETSVTPWWWQPPFPLT